MKLFCWLGYHSEASSTLSDDGVVERTLWRCTRCSNSRITSYCWGESRY